MSYEQLVQPNLSVVGYPDYCLAYVEQVFGVKNDNDPNAWQGWLNTKHKHTDPVPANAVPVWFSWTGTIGGVTQNWGHVAVATPQGVYSNPLTGSGHRVFASVPALAVAYGVKYVGWSEDIGNLIIVKENDMLTPAQVNLLCAIAFNRQARPDEISTYSALPIEEVLNRIETGDESRNLRSDAVAYENSTKPAVLAPGSYQVK